MSNFVALKCPGCGNPLEVPAPAVFEGAAGTVVITGTTPFTCKRCGAQYLPGAELEHYSEGPNTAVVIGGGAIAMGTGAIAVGAGARFITEAPEDSCKRCGKPLGRERFKVRPKKSPDEVETVCPNCRKYRLDKGTWEDVP